MSDAFTKQIRKEGTIWQRLLKREAKRRERDKAFHKREMARMERVVQQAYDDVKTARANASERVADALRALYRHGYQPQYNGRPSCPFCLNFVDDEETHSSSCVLVGLFGPSQADERVFTPITQPKRPNPTVTQH